MIEADIPTRFVKSFAQDAVSPYVNEIPVDSQVGITPGRASLVTGFPPLNFEPLSGGGVPPFGGDMNGILQQITQWVQWQAAGGPVGYNSAFATAVGGYPNGAVVAGAVNGTFWISTVDGNSSNPDAGGGNWLGSAPYLGTAVAGDASQLIGTAPGSSKTASWTISELIAVQGAIGSNLAFKGSALSLNFDGATTGAGGMDTGSTPTSADLYIYAIFNPTTATWNTLGTTASAGPIYTGGNAPSGYTASALIWAGKCDGSGNLVAFAQAGHLVQIAASNAVTTSSSLTPVGLSLSGQIPGTAKTARGYFNIITGTVGDSLLGTTSALLGKIGATGTSVAAQSASYELLCPGQTIFYQTTGTAQTTIVVSGYTF